MNLGCLIAADFASRMVVQIEVPIDGIGFILLGSLLGYWPKSPASLERGFAFKGGAFHTPHIPSSQ